MSPSLAVRAWLPLFLLLQRVRSIQGGPEAHKHFCWPNSESLTPARCCANPPGDPSDPNCWYDGLTFDLCCTRWLQPRMPSFPVDIDKMKTNLDICMRQPALMKPEGPCSKSAYFAGEGAPIGRLLFCAVQVGRVERVLDVFLGSGCSGATALAAMTERDAGVTEGLGDSYVSSESSDSFEVGFGLDSVLESTMSTKSTELSVLVGFEDLDFARARAARSALKAWQPRRVKASTTTLYAVASRLRQDLQGLQGRQKAWILSAQFRSNATGCQKCTTVWTVDCPEKCTYQYGAIEAVCEGLKGIDLVFWDSDGSAADGWLLEWLSIERACAPRFVLLLNLSLPNHGAWIRERLRASGYQEVWWDAKILHPDPYLTMTLSDVRRVRSWALLAYSPSILRQ